MSIIDPGPEAVGGASYQRENLSDQDDVNTTGASHLAGLFFSGKAGKWLATDTPTASATNPVPTFGTFGAGVTAAVAATGYTNTDASGAITVTGTSTGGNILVVTFGTPLASAARPKVSVSCLGATAAINVFVAAVTNTGFTISGLTGVTVANTIFWNAEV